VRRVNMNMNGTQAPHDERYPEKRDLSAKITGNFLGWW